MTARRLRLAHNWPAGQRQRHFARRRARAAVRAYLAAEVGRIAALVAAGRAAR